MCASAEIVVFIYKNCLTWNECVRQTPSLFFSHALLSSRMIFSFICCFIPSNWNWDKLCFDDSFEFAAVDWAEKRKKNIPHSFNAYHITISFSVNLISIPCRLLRDLFSARQTFATTTKSHRFVKEMKCFRNGKRSNDVGEKNVRNQRNNLY